MASAPAVEKPRMSSFRRLFSSPSRCLLLLLVIIPISIIPLSARAEGTSRIDLTPAEQAWLAEHPEIVLGTATGYPPMAIEMADGTHVGVVVDLFEEISRRLDTRIRLHIEDSWADVQKKAQNRELDGLAFGGRDPSRDVLYSATDILMPTYFSVFARSRNEYKLEKFSDLDGMRIGYKKAARPTRSLLEKLPSATLKPYGSHESMTQALLRREVDVIVAWMSYDHWRKEKLQGTIDNIMLIEEYPIQMVSHIRKDWPELIPILNKAIAALKQDELPLIIDKWFGQWPQQSKAAGVPLTPEEQAWLEAKPELGRLALLIRERVTLNGEERDWLQTRRQVPVRVGDYPPFFFVANGVPQGMSIDYVDIVCMAHNLDCRFVPGLTVAESIPSMKQPGGIAIQPGWHKNAEREKVAFFTGTYIDSPFVIFQRKGDKRILDMADLAGRRVVVEKNYAIHRLLKNRFPDLQLVEVDSSTEALKHLSDGTADAYVGSLMAGHYLSLAHGYPNIVVAAPALFEPNRLEIAVRKDWPELASIITKSVAAIKPEEHQIIHSRWLSIEYQKGFDYTLLWKVLAGVGLVFFFIITWNKQLSRKIKERTSQLMESESRFRATFEQAAVGVAHVSLDGRFLRINRKFCEIVGYPEDEIRALTFMDITHPDDLDSDITHLTQVLDGERENFSTEKRYCRKDGSIAWVNLTASLVFDKGGDPKYFVSVIKDISDRRQAEEKLRQSLDFQQHLTSSAPDAIFSIKMPERTIEWANDSFGVLGYETGELVGKRTENFYADPKEYRKISDTLDQAIRDEEDIVRIEAQLRRKNGEAFHADISTSVYRENGAVTSLTAMVRDISERKQAEYALRESEGEKATLREELIQATRRMAMGELTTAIAHELNQPLAAIMVNAQTALDSMKGGTLPPEEMEEILEDIIRDDRRAGDIIGKLRGLLKGDRKDFATLRINEVVEEVLSLVRSDMLIRKIVMEKMLAEDIPPINGDRIQLQQVFLNLILNAADALVEVEKEPRKITVMTQYKDNKEVWISISDTGPGFDDAVKDRLFDPFYTTKSEGMGVGLAICSTIVKLHGGRIQAESSSGGGATFHVVLPNAQEEESPCPD
jgi:PAS domain S-box-containing protein